MAFEKSYERYGYQYEITRVNECLNNGLIECPDFTWDDSIKACKLIDHVRREWKIVYASDCP